MFSMLREGFEDYFRHKNDKDANHLVYQKLRYKRTDKKLWKNVKSYQLKVGDIVKVNKDDLIPADMILLGCSQDKAYIDTKNLDGESNAKLRYPIDNMLDLKTEHQLLALSGHILCDQPNQSFQKWACWIIYGPGEQDSFGIEQQLLRGSKLIQTDFVYGIIAYAGTESKIMLNRNLVRSKSSNVYYKLHKSIFSIFLLQAFICLILTIGAHFHEQNLRKKHGYLDIDEQQDFFDTFIMFWLHYSHMVPISLYVAMEILKLSQKFLIGQDIEMYDEEENERAVVRNSDLIEEIGQVKIILSDKTGTLTQNNLILKHLVIDKYQFGGDDPQGEGLNGDTTAFQILDDPNNPIRQRVDIFLSTLAVCHETFCTSSTVQIDQNGVYRDNLVLQSQYPVDMAILKGLEKLNFKLLDRQTHSIIIKNHYGHDIHFQIMDIIKFDHIRKRMSIILMDDEGKYYLFCKGSDSTLLDNLSDYQEQVTNLAQQGLKVLVVGYRELKKKSYRKWHKEWLKVNAGKEKNQPDIIATVAAKIERKLNILGLVGFEDKLQDRVPQSVKRLTDANIKIWVLTGDHKDTTIEIGRQCGLVSPICEIRQFQ